jgi:hypothetical protein
MTSEIASLFPSRQGIPGAGVAILKDTPRYRPVKKAKKLTAEELRVRNLAFKWGIPCASFRAPSSRRISSHSASNAPSKKPPSP